MARARSLGIPGLAVTVAAFGAYLVYAGVTDTPVVDGLRELLSGRDPRGVGAGYEPDEIDTAAIAAAVAGAGPATTGVTTTGSATGGYGLVGNAARALPSIQRILPDDIVIHGRGARPANPSSDHPKGLAIDVMVNPGGSAGRIPVRSQQLASRVIATFKGTEGAKYWIWNGQIASRDRLWQPRTYTKFGGHYDHVHLSWS